MADYMRQYYKPLAERHKQIVADDFVKAARLATWKKQITNSWDNIEVISIDFPDTTKREFSLGEPYHGEVVLNLKGIHPEDVGVEIVMTKTDEKEIRGHNVLTNLIK